jgi:hypothetical protein
LAQLIESINYSVTSEETRRTLKDKRLAILLLSFILVVSPLIAFWIYLYLLKSLFLPLLFARLVWGEIPLAVVYTAWILLYPRLVRQSTSRAVSLLPLLSGLLFVLVLDGFMIRWGMSGRGASIPLGMYPFERWGGYGMSFYVGCLAPALFDRERYHGIVTFRFAGIVCMTSLLIGSLDWCLSWFLGGFNLECLMLVRGGLWLLFAWTLIVGGRRMRWASYVGGEPYGSHLAGSSGAGTPMAQVIRRFRSRFLGKQLPAREKKLEINLWRTS